jgi:hypothetical protein
MAPYKFDQATDTTLIGTNDSGSTLYTGYTSSVSQKIFSMADIYLLLSLFFVGLDHRHCPQC